MRFRAFTPRPFHSYEVDFAHMRAALLSRDYCRHFMAGCWLPSACSILFSPHMRILLAARYFSPSRFYVHAAAYFSLLRLRLSAKLFFSPPLDISFRQGCYLAFSTRISSLNITHFIAAAAHAEACCRRLGPAYASALSLHFSTRDHATCLHAAPGWLIA